MAFARRPPNRRPKPTPKKSKRYVELGFIKEDEDISKLTTPNGCKPAKGIKWSCPVCGGRWPAFVDAKGDITHAKECRGPPDHKTDAGCPGCAPGIVDSVAGEMPRYEFDPLQCEDLAEKGVGLKEGEFAVSWQFKYPPYRPPPKDKDGDEDPTGLGKGVGWGSLNPRALAPQHVWKYYQARKNYNPRLKNVNGEWVDGFGDDGAKDTETLAEPEGRIVRNETDALFVNRRLHPSSLYATSIQNVHHRKFDGEARPRKYLRVVDHAGLKWSFDDMLDFFKVDKQDAKKPPPYFTSALDRERDLYKNKETLSPDEVREIFRLVTGVEMTDALGADLDKTPLPDKLLIRRVRAEEAFEARRESIRKDAAPHTATRLFHGTCAHNVRSILKHGLEPSTWAVNAALGPGIYLGELRKAKSFSHHCEPIHFLEGFVEGERIGRRFRSKLNPPPPPPSKGAPGTVTYAPGSLLGPAFGPAPVALTVVNPTAASIFPNVGSASVVPALVSTAFAHVNLSALSQDKLDILKFFIEKLVEEFDEGEWDALVDKKKPDNLLDLWAGVRPGRIERRWKKKNVFQRVRFVFEVDALLGHSYRITNPEDVVNNETPRRFAFRGGAHSVYCTRFKQDEWCVYRPDQVHLRRVNIYVDDKEGVW